MGDWTLDPLQLGGVLVVAVAYAVRARTLARRGQPVPVWRVALFALGLVLLVAALVSPVATLGEERFSFHMVQHLLLGDLAPLALLAGLTGPLLRPLLALPPVHALRRLAHPLVALPLWIANLYLWHLPFAYEGAIENSAVHALEHLSFFAAGLLMWAPVLEKDPADDVEPDAGQRHVHTPNEDCACPGDEKADCDCHARKCSPSGKTVAQKRFRFR